MHWLKSRPKSQNKHIISNDNWKQIVKPKSLPNQTKTPWAKQRRHRIGFSFLNWLAVIVSVESHPQRMISVYILHLNHLPLNTMAAILADDIFKWIFMNEKFCILISISLKFVPKGPIENKSALVQVMVWRRIGDKPLPEPKLTQITDAYMRHYRGRWVNP